MAAPIAESISTLAQAFASRLTIAALTLVEEAAIWNATTPPKGPALFARIFVSIYFGIRAWDRHTYHSRFS